MSMPTKSELFEQQLAAMSRSENDADHEALNDTIFNPEWMAEFLKNEAWDAESAVYYAANIAIEVAKRFREYDT